MCYTCPVWRNTERTHFKVKCKSRSQLERESLLKRNSFAVKWMQLCVRLQVQCVYVQSTVHPSVLSLFSSKVADACPLSLVLAFKWPAVSFQWIELEAAVCMARTGISQLCGWERRGHKHTRLPHSSGLTGQRVTWCPVKGHSVQWPERASN